MDQGYNRDEKSAALTLARDQSLNELMLSIRAVHNELAARQHSINPRTRLPYEEFFVPLKRLRYLVACEKSPRGTDAPDRRDMARDDGIQIGEFMFFRSRFYKDRRFQRALDARYFDMMHEADSFCRVRVEMTGRGMPYLAVSFPILKHSTPERAADTSIDEDDEEGDNGEDDDNDKEDSNVVAQTSV